MKYISDINIAFIRKNNRINELNINTRNNVISILSSFYTFNFVNRIHTDIKINMIHIKSTRENNDEEERILCPICFEDIDTFKCIKTNCNHHVCNACFSMYMQNYRILSKPSCVYCRTTITDISMKDESSLHIFKSMSFGVRPWYITKPFQGIG
jgi:hypothetical protein